LRGNADVVRPLPPRRHIEFAFEDSLVRDGGLRARCAYGATKDDADFQTLVAVTRGSELGSSMDAEGRIDSVAFLASIGGTLVDGPSVSTDSRSTTPPAGAAIGTGYDLENVVLSPPFSPVNFHGLPQPPHGAAGTASPLALPGAAALATDGVNPLGQLEPLNGMMSQLPLGMAMPRGSLSGLPQGSGMFCSPNQVGSFGQVPLAQHRAHAPSSLRRTRRSHDHTPVRRPFVALCCRITASAAESPPPRSCAARPGDARRQRHRLAGGPLLLTARFRWQEHGERALVPTACGAIVRTMHSPDVRR
jgi:hypothetical protein